MEQWFEATAGQVSAARHWVVEALEGHGCEPAAVEVAALVTTELAANVLRHTDSDRIGITVRYDPPQVRLGIIDCDPAAERPTPRPPDPASEHGRGLLIVEGLTSDWGVTTSPGRRTVWADLDCVEAARG